MRTPRLLPLGLALGAAVLLTSPAAAQCPGTDDAFEDNDDCSTPWALAAGNYPGLYTEKETLDQDYFQISVPNNHQVVVTINFSHAQADTDMRLWDLGCVTQLDSSASTSDTETVSWVNSTGATIDVIAQVFVYSNAANDCNDYDMDVVVQPDPCSTSGDDSLEDNDDCATAISGITGSHPGLFVSKADLDYYAYSLADGSTIDASAFFTHAAGDIDIILYDASACGGGLGTGLVQGSSVTDDEILTYTNTSGAPMSLVLEVNVWTNSTTDCNVYDLLVAIDGGSGPIGSSYCGPANLNSTGLPARLTAFGSETVAQNDVRLTTIQMPANQFGYYINSQTQGFASPPGSQGNLCVAGQIGRHSANVLSTGAAGEFFLQLDLTDIPTPGGPVAIQPGETWNWQAWFRDVNPTTTNNFSDGLTVTFN